MHSKKVLVDTERKKNIDISTSVSINPKQMFRSWAICTLRIASIEYKYTRANEVGGPEDKLLAVWTASSSPVNRAQNKQSSAAKY
jgi:hypothetical protein